METRTESGIILPYGSNMASSGQQTSTPLTSFPSSINLGSIPLNSDNNGSITSSTTTSTSTEFNNDYLNLLNYVNDKLKENSDDIKNQFQQSIVNIEGSIKTDYTNLINTYSSRLTDIETKLNDSKEDKKHNQVLWIAVITALITIVLPVLTGVAVITTNKYETINQLVNKVEVNDEKIKQLEDDTDEGKKSLKEIDQKINSLNKK